MPKHNQLKAMKDFKNLFKELDKLEHLTKNVRLIVDNFKTEEDDEQNPHQTT